MNNAYLILENGTFLFSSYVEFSRLPNIDEYIYIPGETYQVLGVLHFWVNEGDTPIAQITIRLVNNAASLNNNLEATAPKK